MRGPRQPDSNRLRLLYVRFLVKNLDRYPGLFSPVSCRLCPRVVQNLAATTTSPVIPFLPRLTYPAPHSPHHAEMLVPDAPGSSGGLHERSCSRGVAAGGAGVNADESEGLSLLPGSPRLMRESASFSRSGSLSLARIARGLQTSVCLARFWGTSLASAPSASSSGLPASEPVDLNYLASAAI